MDASLMVERKLSGVYLRREVEIPYAWFEKYVKNMREQLDGHALQIDEATIANNPAVIAEFEKSVEECIESCFEDPDDSIGDPWSFADNMFAAEIAAKREEQLELIRKANVTAKKNNYIDKALPIHPRYRAKAIELLKQAGMFDEYYHSHIERKLKDQSESDDSEQ